MKKIATIFTAGGLSDISLRRNAKNLKRDKGLTYSEALDATARMHGYADWKDFCLRGEQEKVE